jgi:hypothetical protein
MSLDFMSFYKLVPSTQFKYKTLVSTFIHLVLPQALASTRYQINNKVICNSGTLSWSQYS